METCPFCKSSLNEGAVVCHNCNAQKGYMSDNAGNVIGRDGTILRLVVASAASFFFTSKCFGMFGEMVGNLTFYLGIVCWIAVGIGFLRLLSGPRWFR